MSTAQYYVVGNNDVWMIQFKDTENGQYKSSNEAISFAIRRQGELKAGAAGQVRARPQSSIMRFDN
jgi:hypothetical protein